MRDRYVPKTPPKGVAEQLAAPVEEIWDSATGRYEGEELERVRARRPTPERLRILERKQDEDRTRLDGLVEVVTDVRVSVGEMRGELRAALSLVPEKHKTERTRIDARKAVLIAALGTVATLAGYLMAGCL